MHESIAELVTLLEPYKNFELLAERLRRLAQANCEEFRKVRIRSSLRRKEFADALNIETHTLDKFERGAPLQLPVPKLIHVINQYMKLQRKEVETWQTSGPSCDSQSTSRAG